MLLVVVFPTEGSRYANGHIVAGGDRAFCGAAVPTVVIECGMDDPRNPFVGKGTITCTGCLTEYNNGRREGYRETSQ